jgi:hypothetical protein
LSEAKLVEKGDVRLRLLALFNDLGLKCGSNPAVIKVSARDQGLQKVFNMKGFYFLVKGCEVSPLFI